jgi:hypothetical protein
MFRAKYELLSTLFIADPLFSSLYELFAQKHRDRERVKRDSTNTPAPKRRKPRTAWGEAIRGLRG